MSAFAVGFMPLELMVMGALASGSLDRLSTSHLRKSDQVNIMFRFREKISRVASHGAALLALGASGVLASAQQASIYVEPVTDLLGSLKGAPVSVQVGPTLWRSHAFDSGYTAPIPAEPDDVADIYIHRQDTASGTSVEQHFVEVAPLLEDGDDHLSFELMYAVPEARKVVFAQGPSDERSLFYDPRTPLWRAVPNLSSPDTATPLRFHAEVAMLLNDEVIDRYTSYLDIQNPPPAEGYLQGLLIRMPYEYEIPSAGISFTIHKIPTNGIGGYCSFDLIQTGGIGSPTLTGLDIAQYTTPGPHGIGAIVISLSGVLTKGDNLILLYNGGSVGQVTDVPTLAPGNTTQVGMPVASLALPPGSLTPSAITGPVMLTTVTAESASFGSNGAPDPGSGTTAHPESQDGGSAPSGLKKCPPEEPGTPCDTADAPPLSGPSWISQWWHGWSNCSTGLAVSGSKKKPGPVKCGGRFTSRQMRRAIKFGGSLSIEFKKGPVEVDVAGKGDFTETDVQDIPACVCSALFKCRWLTYATVSCTAETIGHASYGLGTTVVEYHGVSWVKCTGSDVPLEPPGDCMMDDCP